MKLLRYIEFFSAAFLAFTLISSSYCVSAEIEREERMNIYF